jgi:predicted  nucleic acid-binding Zn-ribbon protein
MNENTDNRPLPATIISTNPATPWLLILAIGVLGAGGYAIYLGTQTQDLKQRFAAAQKDNATLRTELADNATELQGALTSLRDDLSQTQQDATASLAKAQTAVTRHSDIVAAQLAKKTSEQAEQLNAELGKVKESTADASSKIDGITTDVGAVKTDVGTVKNDVASTRSALDETRSDLQRARGDMGVMSGLVATNGKQIQELRDMGDRNIYEFTLAKNGKMQKVGDIELALRKADAGHSRFSLDVMADDKRVEKKDRTVNEPVQFYTSKAHQPYEIVVNQVQKNQITGYLATPKVTIARDSSPTR